VPGEEIKRDFRIQETAWKLCETLGRDPTKKEVRTAIETRGIRIESRDWPKIWKRCKLTFLIGERGGRPRKKPSDERGNVIPTVSPVIDSP
jgi:hypothetical protein